MYDDDINYYGFPRELGAIRLEPLPSGGGSGGGGGGSGGGGGGDAHSGAHSGARGGARGGNVALPCGAG